jgi:hypothetical protein
MPKKWHMLTKAEFKDNFCKKIFVWNDIKNVQRRRIQGMIPSGPRFISVCENGHQYCTLFASVGNPNK